MALKRTHLSTIRKRHVSLTKSMRTMTEIYPYTLVNSQPTCTNSISFHRICVCTTPISSSAATDRIVNSSTSRSSGGKLMTSLMSRMMTMMQNTNSIKSRTRVVSHREEVPKTSTRLIKTQCSRCFTKVGSKQELMCLYQQMIIVLLWTKKRLT